jgi:hypothetical protein
LAIMPKVGDAVIFSRHGTRSDRVETRTQTHRLSIGIASSRPGDLQLNNNTHRTSRAV